MTRRIWFFALGPCLTSNAQPLRMALDTFCRMGLNVCAESTKIAYP